MRIVLISDSHTAENIGFILNYLEKKSDWKPDAIIINGDILGENEVREGYGYNFSKPLFFASLNKEELLKKACPEKAGQLRAAVSEYEKGMGSEKAELEFSQLIKDYVAARY